MMVPRHGPHVDETVVIVEGERAAVMTGTQRLNAWCDLRCEILHDRVSEVRWPEGSFKVTQPGATAGVACC